MSNGNLKYTTTHIDKPSIDGAEHEIISFVGDSDGLLMIQHPSKFDGREVGRERNTSTVKGRE